MEKKSLGESELAINYLTDKTCDTCEYVVYSKGASTFCWCRDRTNSAEKYSYTDIPEERTCEFWDWKG